VRPAVNIRADSRDGTVSLCIEDNGIGIDEADRERVFHVFERLPAAEAYPGIGVGLTVARRGVERMGGRISVTATRDHGTTFIIELPASKKAK
jgi:signal transduction histidine kinase